MENVTNVTFSDRLKSLMASRNLNNARVAEAIGLSHVAIGHYVRGDRMPGAMELYKLAKFFGVQMEWFIEGEIETVESIKRATTFSEAVVESSNLPEGEKPAAFDELVERFYQLEKAMLELRNALAHAQPSKVYIDAGGEKTSPPSSASDVAGAKLLKKGAASVPGPSPKSSRSRGAASPTSQTSSPKRGADKA